MFSMIQWYLAMNNWRNFCEKSVYSDLEMNFRFNCPLLFDHFYECYRRLSVTDY